MSQQYLFTCECGEQIAILPRQAGESRSCQCGGQIVLPTFREIRQLPTLETDETKEKAKANWTIGHGLAFSFGIPILLIGLCWLGYDAWRYNRLNTEAPTVEDLIAASPDYLTQLDFEQLSLVDSYEQVWKPLEKLALRTRPTPGFVQRREFAKYLIRRMSIAGGGAALGLLLALGSIVGSKI